MHVSNARRHPLAWTLIASTALALAFAAPPARADGHDDDGHAFRFAVLCDSRSSYASDPAGTTSPYYSSDGTSPYFHAVAAALAREEGLSFVVYPGDLVRGKKPALTGAAFAADLDAWNAYMQPVYQAGLPVLYVRGNHDAYEVSDAKVTGVSAADLWRQHVSQPGQGPNPALRGSLLWDTDPAGGLTTFALHYGGSLFVGIDEYPSGASAATGFDQAFVSAQLARRANHRFAFGHQPVWNFKSDELGPVALAAALQAGQVDLYFSGHVHSYQRISEAGFRFQELILGTGGAPQDYPTLVSGGAAGQYLADPKLTVEAYAGGPDANARFGYAVVEVHGDGRITTAVKFVDDPLSTASSVSIFDQAQVKPGRR